LNTSDPLSVKLPRPHAEQERFINSPAKRKIIRAGRRSGKTVGVSIMAVQKFIEGGRVLYCAPTEEQTGAFWSEVKRALACAVGAGLFIRNETDRFIELPGSKQRISAKTAWNADTLRSDFCDLLILDEWQLQPESVWSEVCAPMMLDSNGDAVFVYTPPSLHSRASSKATDPRHAAKLFKIAAADKSGRWEAFHFSSHANPYISAVALSEIACDMTQLAIRQEIEAEDVEEIAGALWTQALIDETRVDVTPDLRRIVVAIDPSGSSKTTADECGIVVAGLGRDGHGYVLEDLSLRATPRVWAGVAVGAFHKHHCDRVIAEQNFGGEMVELTLHTVDDNIPYKAVNASRGKVARAEPISALYEKRLVHHVGVFEALEGGLTSYVPGNKSPNRLDAVVWALSELMLNGQSFGLIEWLKNLFANPKARAEALGVEVTPKPQITVVKPVLEAELPGKCPACGAVCISPCYSGWRCAQCAHQFGGSQTITRAAFVNGMPGLIVSHNGETHSRVWPGGKSS
jgi:Terminase RNaseH-like domain